AAVPSRRPSAATSRRFAEALAGAGWPVVVTGGPQEIDLTATVAGAAAAGGRRGRIVDAGSRLTLPDLASVLAGAEVVIAPNTGPAHLAAAVGTPVVALHAPVVAFEQWGPYGVPRVRLGDQTAPCRSSRARVCPVPGHVCLDSIRPDEVVHAVRTLAPQDSDQPPDERQHDQQRRTEQRRDSPPSRTADHPTALRTPERLRP
ncbi:MAG: glycosyltransferase family 9 protein, partial [Microlunatus sp.]|nr:glycosyltransferase family 9 protein [Microlunatus sp.]